MINKKPLFSILVSKYFNLKLGMSVTLKRGLIGKSGYMCKKYPGLVASFGFEGDKHAPIAYIDGSYRIRDRKLFITFGLKNIVGKIKWYNKEGWLPCFVSEFNTDNFYVCIESFADKVEVDGLSFEVVYSRLKLKNITSFNVKLPKPSKKLILLSNNSKKKTLDVGEEVIMDYCIVSDRFGCNYSFPADVKISNLGGFDEHFEIMKNYWKNKLSKIAQINKLPDKRLIDAYKAGYVYTMIIKDGDELHVGENGYDRVFDHDVIGIIATLLTIGDFEHFEKYSEHILKNIQYPDARWKYSWVFALYLQKTGNIDLIRKKFDDIKSNTHFIERDRCNDGKGIMKKTIAIDSNGHWTIDNWSALFGLLTYKYICDKTGNKSESSWAQSQYNCLLKISNKTIGETIKKHNLQYLPISMTEPNEFGARQDPRDANWASMFLFGRWAWDGYLFGANQQGCMLDLIDDTYYYGFDKRKEINGNHANFGGYPHGYFCSSYNAGYASSALRGQKYRDLGIKAYQFMIDFAQSGPYSWWEGIDYPDKASPWNINHCPRGGGSCQHMWGQAVATKVLFDSLICEKSDGSLIIGRGIPREWLWDGEEIEVENYPISRNRRVGFNIKTQGNNITVHLLGDEIDNDTYIEFPLLGNKDVIIPSGNKSKTTKI
ncbi:MAG TPA: carbohydrate-binding protein [Clostridia bacterium]|nr:carbohydrate-binding protein [Clostridia bacterium]